MNICENCEKEHNGEYGSGRFCSSKCARCFSTKEKRQEINKKVSETLFKTFNDGLSLQQVIQRKIKEKHASYVRETEVTTIFDLSSRTVSKIFKRLKLPCSYCGWYHIDVVCDFHHIIERKNGGSNEHDNITYVCPNCHRLIHNGIIHKETLITLDKYVGNSWKDYYYIKNKKLVKKGVVDDWQSSGL